MLPIEALTQVTAAKPYLHLVTRLVVNGWTQSKFRDLLADRILTSHPDLSVGDPDSLPLPAATR